MNLKRKTWQLSIFVKLVLIFLAVIIPLYTVSLIINGWGSKSIRNEISKAMFSKEQFYLNSLEYEVLHIRNRQFECLKDDNLQLLSIASEKMTDYEKVMAINELQKKLQNMKDSSSYIKNVSVYIPSIDKTISTTITFDKIYEDEFKAIVELPRKSESPVIYWENKIFLSASYPESSFLQMKTPMFVISTELSQKELSKALEQFIDYKGSGFILTNNNQDWFITTNKDADILSNVKAFLQRRSDNKTVGQIENIRMNGQYYLVLHNVSNYLNMTLLAYVPEEKVIGPLKMYRIWFWVSSIVSIAIMVFFSYYIYRLIHRPLLNLVRSYRKVDEGELDIYIKHKSNDEFSFLYQHFNIMVDKLKELIHQVYKEKLLAQRAELKHLQSQINPHFLYNSFYMLHRMIKSNDNENAVCFSQQLGRYFEFITRSAADEVPLYMEVDHARIYMEIQAMRFSNHFVMEFGQLPDRYRNITVPRLILQPLIENAFEHGIKDKVKDGIIKVKIDETEKGLYISVEDNGDQLDDKELSELQNFLNYEEYDVETTGLLNINRRMRFKFGSSNGLTAVRGQLGGLLIKIHIPVETETEVSV